MQAVAILGPRQTEKTTLALEIADQHASLYFDLSLDAHRARLDHPAAYLRSMEISWSYLTKSIGYLNSSAP